MVYLKKKRKENGKIYFLTYLNEQCNVKTRTLPACLFCIVLRLYIVYRYITSTVHGAVTLKAFQCCLQIVVNMKPADPPL